MQQTPTITGRQCHAARVLLDWKQSDLADACGASVRTICSFETGASRPRQMTCDAIMAALMYNGIVFLPEGGVNFAPKEEQADQ